MIRQVIFVILEFFEQGQKVYFETKSKP